MAGIGGSLRLPSRLRSRKAFAASAAAAAGVVSTAILIVALNGGGTPAAAPATTVAPTTAATTAVAPTTAATTTTVAPTTTTTTVAPSTTAVPTTAAPTTAATTTAPPTTTPPLTIPTDTRPIAPPADTHAQEPVIALGRIVIPKIGVDMDMYEGIRMTTLDRGPGHWPGSAMPGSGGNVVVGGHRTSKHAVFRHVDQLAAGDEIVFVGGDGAQHIYVVNRIEIVDPTAVWIVEPTETPQATLFACHPPGSTRERIIVFSDYRETIPAQTA